MKIGKVLKRDIRKYLKERSGYVNIMYKANMDCWYGHIDDHNNPYVRGDAGYRFIGSTADIIKREIK